MGNAIAKRFDLPKEHTATAGHVNNWKIWPGKSKDSSGNLVSIWAFDKTDVMKRKQNPITDKTILEQLFQIMKKDFNLIKDSKTCSQIIQCLEIVEDSKNAIVFTTERIICSLSDLLSNFEHIPGGFAEQTSFFDAIPTISEIEISRGLYNVSQGLQYLHTVQRKLHMNINPESIVITASGQWKLCGFGMSLSFAQGEQQRIASPYFMQPTASNVLTLVQRLEPDLRYSSPESTDGGLNPAGTRYVSTVSDVFSLGVIIYETYRHNLSKHRNSSPIYDLKPSIAIVHVTCNDINQHHSSLKVIQNLDYSFLPGALVQLVVSMMQLNPQMRVSENEISSHTYFSSGTQAVLNMIDTMSSRDVGTQSSQLISLQSEIATFSPRILIYTVLPTISKLCLQNNTLWVYALPLFSLMAKIIPDDKFAHLAGPFIIQALSTTKDLSTDTLQAFLCNLSFLCRSFSHEFFQGSLASLVCQSLERPNLFLQNLTLEKLSEEYVYSIFSTSTLSDKIVPLLCKEACKNPEPNIKTQALYVISLVTWKLDEVYVANNILPSLRYIVDNERTPAVSMSVIGNFESISNSLGLNYVASSILPVLQGMLLDEALDRNQFEMIVNIVKRLLKKILDHRTKQLQMPEISVAEVVGKNVEDPFAPAKALIAQAKQRNIANNYGMVTGAYSSSSSSFTSDSNNNNSGNNNDGKRNSVGNIPPPAPAGPPPPPPPGHAPPSEFLSSGNPLFTSSSSSSSSSASPYTMSERELPGIYQKRGSIGGLAMASGIVPSSAIGDNNGTNIAPYQSNFNSTTTTSSSSSVLNFSGTGPIDLTSTLSAKSSSQYDDKKSYSNSSNSSLGQSSSLSIADNKSTSSTSSMFGWFSSKQGQGKESNSAITTGAISSNYGSSSSGYSGGESSSSYTPPVIPGGNNNNNINDVDDFLSSFGQQQQSNTNNNMSSSSSSSSRYSDNKDTSKYNNSSLLSSSQTTSSIPINTQSNTINTSLTIQQQIEQTQLEISRLSTTQHLIPPTHTTSSMNPSLVTTATTYNNIPQLSSYSSTIATMSSGGVGQWGTTTTNTSGTLGMLGVNPSSQQLPLPQQQFYGSHNSMNTGYAPPVVATTTSNNISLYPHSTTNNATATTTYQPPYHQSSIVNSNLLIPNYNTTTTTNTSSSTNYQQPNTTYNPGNNFYSSQHQTLNYNNYNPTINATNTTNNIGYYNNNIPNTQTINQTSNIGYTPPGNILPHTNNNSNNNNNTTINRTTINKTQDPFDFLN